jgi:hypothetical protein
MTWTRIVPISAILAAIAGVVVFAVAGPAGTTMSFADGAGTSQTPPHSDGNPWND